MRALFCRVASRCVVRCVRQAFAFDDGSPPPDEIINSWLKLVKDVFSKKSKGGAAGGGGGAKKDKAKSKEETKQVPCIAIHCVAGLGRAPLMVAIALVQAGVAYTKAVEVIRAKRFVLGGCPVVVPPVARKSSGLVVWSFRAVSCGTVLLLLLLTPVCTLPACSNSTFPSAVLDASTTVN